MINESILLIVAFARIYL